MKKVFIIPAFFCLAFVGCDVRNSDTQATTTTSTENNLKTDELVKNTEGNTTLQANNPAPAAAQVDVIDKTYNFGSVQDGAVVEYSYRFKNTGTTPLIINSATGSCGCTVPEKPEQPILPGETGFIKVKFDSKGRVGATHKTVTIASNANPEFPVLELTGDVTAKK